MGRPTKLTPALQKKIVGKIRKGVAPQTAAVSSGVGVSTWDSWKKKGREGKDPYAGLVEAVEEAEAEIAARAESMVVEAFTGLDTIKLREKKGINPLTGAFEVIEEVEEIITRVYPEFALKWLERRRASEWGKRPLPPHPDDDDTPDAVEAAPTYTDPWLETDEENVGEEDKDE